MSIVFDNVSYDYAPEAKAGDSEEHPLALRDVSFEIPDGQFVGIIGHTGSGKSTLIQHMNGLLQPTSGRVLVDGLDLAEKANRRQVRRRVGVAFQYPEYQLFATTVEEDVAFGPRNLGVEGEELTSSVRTAIERVGLDPEVVCGKSPFHLSGGQQRRVALAGILAMEPQILVLDEPMAGLDPKGRADTLALVHRLHSEGLTVVMVSHSMEDVAENAERVIVMSSGEVRMDGTPEQVFSRSTELREIGLGIPHSTTFARKLAERGMDLGEDVHTIDALADAIARRIGTRSKEEFLALAARATEGGDAR